MMSITLLTFCLQSSVVHSVKRRCVAHVQNCILSILSQSGSGGGRIAIGGATIGSGSPWRHSHTVLHTTGKHSGVPAVAPSGQRFANLHFSQFGWNDIVLSSYSAFSAGSSG